MFRNYLKTAWRNLLKNKFYSLLNIAGLTAGLATGILILLWVRDESGYDAFEKKGPSIYRMEIFGGTGASRQIWTADVAPMGPLAKQLLPEVREQARMVENNSFSLYSAGRKSFTEDHAAFTDPSIFTMFDLVTINGDAAHPFPSASSVVLTESTALKYFGSTAITGRILTADKTVLFTVSAVVKDFPKNSFLKDIHMLMPMAYLKTRLLAVHQDMDNDFSSFNYMTFLQLEPGTEMAALKTKLRNIHLAHKADDTDVSYLLLPLAKNHLYNADGTNHGIETVNLFNIVALLILSIACINYVNLSTARSMLRAKEISMRKIAGAAKHQLFIQFVVETTILFLLAAILSILLIAALMPVFNRISGKELVFNLGDYHIWILILITIAGTLVASSIYPALLLSSLEPLKALKGRFSASPGDALFRKILVVIQFTFSVVLITGTLMITRQLDFIHKASIGYDKNYVFSFRMREAGTHYEAVRAELLKSSAVKDITRTSNTIFPSDNITGDNDWDGKAPHQTFIVHPLAIDRDLISFFKLKIVSGRPFTGAVADSTHFILNETAVKETGLKDPVGKRFRLWGQNGTITGVVRDFHLASLREKIAPVVLYYHPSNLATLYIRTSAGGAAEAIQAAKVQFSRYNGEYPFSYTFLDETFDSLYRSEQQESTLLNYFSGIAILISCLGLLGLAAFTAQVRTREIGVRKVLGASVSSIITLLAADFIWLIFIAICIAIPVAWYTINSWLQSYAYKASLNWTVFLSAGVIALIIALITLSFQTMKAALASPVKSLRNN